MPSTWRAIMESMIWIWRSYSVSCAGPFQSTLTPSSLPAAMAPAWTEIQNRCAVPFGITAIVFMPLPWQEVSSSAMAIAAASGLPRTPASVDQHVRPRYERRMIGAEKQRKLADLFHFSPAANRNGGEELRVLLRIVHEREVHFGCARA